MRSLFVQLLCCLSLIGCGKESIDLLDFSAKVDSKGNLQLTGDGFEKEHSVQVWVYGSSLQKAVSTNAHISSSSSVIAKLPQGLLETLGFQGRVKACIETQHSQVCGAAPFQVGPSLSAASDSKKHGIASGSLLEQLDLSYWLLLSFLLLTLMWFCGPVAAYVREADKKVRTALMNRSPELEGWVVRLLLLGILALGASLFSVVVFDIQKTVSWLTLALVVCACFPMTARLWHKVLWFARCIAGAGLCLGLGLVFDGGDRNLELWRLLAACACLCCLGLYFLPKDRHKIHKVGHALLVLYIARVFVFALSIPDNHALWGSVLLLVVGTLCWQWIILLQSLNLKGWVGLLVIGILGSVAYATYVWPPSPLGGELLCRVIILTLLLASIRLVSLVSQKSVASTLAFCPSDALEKPPSGKRIDQRLAF